MTFDEIKSSLLDDRTKAAEKESENEKRINDYLDYTIRIIQDHMNFDVETKTVSAFIPRSDVTSEYWDKFDSNDFGNFPARLRVALNRKLEEEGVLLVFSSLCYEKTEGEEDEHIFFSFRVVLGN